MSYARYDGWFRTVVVVNRRSRDDFEECWVPFVGVLLLLISVIFLFYSESSVDISDTVQNALPYPSSLPLDGQLIYTIGQLDSHSTLQDNFLTPQPFMALHVFPEMYSWHEVRHSHTREESDGSKTTYYTYDYYTGWSSNPSSSMFFENPLFHHNPPGRIYRCEKLGGSIYASEATINNLTVANLSRLGLPQYTLTIGKSDVIPNDDLTISSNYLYIDGGSTWFPSVGDIRISYKFTPPALGGVVIGQLKGNGITEYPARRSNVFMTRVEEFMRYVDAPDLQKAVEVLHREWVRGLWLVRAICLCLNVAGVAILGRPAWMAIAIWSLGLVVVIVRLVAALNSWTSLAGVVSVVAIWGIWMAVGDSEHYETSGKVE